MKTLGFFLVSVFLFGCTPAANFTGTSNSSRSNSSTSIKSTSRYSTKVSKSQEQEPQKVNKSTSNATLKTGSNPKYVTPSKKYHIVKRKDNLTKLSKKYNISVNRLMLYNNLTSDTLLLGQKVYLTPVMSGKKVFVTIRTIPKSEYHLLDEGEDMFTISKMYDIFIMDLLDYNLLESFSLDGLKKVWLTAGHTGQITKQRQIAKATQPLESSKDENKTKTTTANKVVKPTEVIKAEVQPIKLPKKKYSSPVLQGDVVAGFGKNGLVVNKGVDIAAPLGSSISAITDGNVIFAGSQKGYGNVIILEHKDNVMTVYAHNQRNLVRTADRVKKNQPIATVGQTGRADFPKLHFEYRIKGKAVNPAKVISL